MKQPETVSLEEPVMQTADSQNQEKDPFDLCDYYDARGNAECLTCDSPEEAIGDLVDGHLDPECDVAAVILGMGPIVVTGYNRKEVDPGTAKQWAKRFADSMNEWWPEEEYGNPDEDADAPGTSQFIAEVTPIIQAAIDRTAVWSCDDVATREYSAEEVLALMRIEHPYWFEGQGGTEPEKTEPAP